MASECRSYIHEAVWRRVFSTDVGLAVVRRVAEAVSFRSPEGLRTTAWEIANALGWATTYDAE